MNDKEYTYDIDKYTIGVDTNGEDGIGMTVAKIENGKIKFLGNCYGENARCIDLLIEENKELKKQLEEKENIACNWKDSCLENAGKIEILETQQKEFIRYLEDEIQSCEAVSDLLFNSNKEMKVYEKILQKYKEIIGASDETN